MTKTEPPKHNTKSAGCGFAFLLLFGGGAIVGALEGAACEQYDFFMEVPCRWDNMFMILYLAVLVGAGIILYVTHK